MLFLDDFLEMLDELPTELRDRCTEMRQIDLQVQTGIERNRKSILEFFESGSQLSEEEKQRHYQLLQEEYARLRLLVEEKVDMAERMQELVEKYVQHLDKEKTHFKYELEADNPGITETIEKRFSDYVESVITMRKDRKRKHTTNGSARNGEPGNKMSKFSDGFSLDHVVNTAGLTDEELLSPLMPMLSTSASSANMRGRKNTYDEMASPVPKKRPSLGSIKSSFSIPSALNGISLSPAISEKSWNSSAVHLDDHSPSSTMSSNPLAPAVTPSLSAFVEPESRHGRPRKLTSRVQEMFTEAVQRQRRHHPAMHHVETEDNEGSDSDDAEKKWCFCQEASYGEMVACDNKECSIQWFHYECVNITAPPKGKWFCPDCVQRSDRGIMDHDSGHEFGIQL